MQSLRIVAILGILALLPHFNSIDRFKLFVFVSDKGMRNAVVLTQGTLMHDQELFLFVLTLNVHQGNMLLRNSQQNGIRLILADPEARWEFEDFRQPHQECFLHVSFFSERLISNCFAIDLRLRHPHAFVLLSDYVYHLVGDKIKILDHARLLKPDGILVVNIILTEESEVSIFHFEVVNPCGATACPENKSITIAAALAEASRHLGEELLQIVLIPEIFNLAC